MIKTTQQAFLISIPFFVSAASVSAAQTLSDISERIYSSFMGPLTNLLLTAAMLFFAWGVVKFIFSEGDKKAAAKDRLFWATVALFVMVSFWGILRIINNTFFTDELGEGKYETDLHNKIQQVNVQTGVISIPTSN